MLDLIGYATAPEDALVAKGLLDDFFRWMLTLPSWMTFAAMFGGYMWLTWVSWPRHAPSLPAPPKQSLIGTTKATNSNASVAASMRYALGHLRGFKKRLDAQGGFDLNELNELAAKFRATEVSLQKIGYPIPWLDVNVDPIGYIERNIDYLSKVEPLISGGHEREAKRQAHLIVETFHSDFVDPNRL